MISSYKTRRGSSVVERGTRKAYSRNPEVAGSNPARGSTTLFTVIMSTHFSCPDWLFISITLRTLITNRYLMSIANVKKVIITVIVQLVCYLESSEISSSIIGMSLLNLETQPKFLYHLLK